MCPEWDLEHPYQGITTPQLPSLGLTPHRLPPRILHGSPDMSPQLIYSTPKIPANLPTFFNHSHLLTPTTYGLQTPRTRVLSALSDVRTPLLHTKTPHVRDTGPAFSSPFVHIRTPRSVVVPEVLPGPSRSVTPTIRGWSSMMPPAEPLHSSLKETVGQHHTIYGTPMLPNR